MKFLHPFLFLLLLPKCLISQNITVVNHLTKTPIAGVAIFNIDKSKTAISNFNGEANLSAFSNTETIYFKHISFIPKTIIKQQLKLANIVYLTSNTQDLNQIIISASKFKQHKKDIPQKIVSITGNNIQFTNPQTSADLLESTGLVYIQKSQLGGGSPMIRGFSTNRLLITVDGVRMNNAIFRSGNLQNVISIDPFSIQNTEVTLGAGSIIYGSDAIGGVMSFYTKNPKLSYTDTLLFNANTVFRYATANEEKTGHFDFNLGYKKWGFTTSSSYTNFNDLRMGNHGPEDYLRPEYIETTNNIDAIVENKNPLIQKFSGYSQINFMQKARYESSDDLSLDLGLFYTTTSDIPRYDRLIQYKNNVLRSAEWYYGPQTWFMSNIQFTKSRSNSTFYDKIKSTIAYQNFQETRVNRAFQSSIKRIREETVNAYSFNLDFDKKINRKTHFFYGLDYVYNKVNSIANKENINTNTQAPIVSRYPNGATWQSMAVYTNIKYTPNSKFTLQSGLRYNHIASKADFTENNILLNLPFNTSENKTSALTGSAGISWSPNKTIVWKLNTSTAFRAPNIDDLGKVFNSEPGALIVPNTALKPEYAYGGSLNLKLNFNNKVILDMNTYYTYLDNALVRRNYHLNGETEVIYDDELSRVQAIQNASKTAIYGFEVGTKINITNTIKLTSQYNIIGGYESDDTIKIPVRHIPPYFGNTHLTWTLHRLKMDFFSNYNSELSHKKMAPSEKEKDYIYTTDANGNSYSPSWHTFNFRTQYKINHSTTITASIENITDQRYRIYASGITAAGRNIIIALKYSL